MITKKDYLIVAANGFLTGFFLLLILRFLNFSFQYQYAAALLGVPAVWLLGMFAADLLSRRFPFFAQFAKFAASGLLSAAIDFSVLNFISFATGINAGVRIGWVNAPGFMFAVVNGYVWNQLWTFKAYRGENLFHDFPKFLAVTVTGLIINSFVIILLTTYIGIPFGISETLWLNVAKVLANIVAMIWNFTGYKFVVFIK